MSRSRGVRIGETRKEIPYDVISMINPLKTRLEVSWTADRSVRYVVYCQFVSLQFNYIDGIDEELGS